jgi:hypothetical protein
MTPPICRWPIPRLLATGEPGERELLRRFRIDPPAIVREVAGRRLSCLVSQRVSTMAPNLKPFLARELGAVAQRRAALCALDALAGERGIRPLVFKGAANALTYYANETLRSSQDLDILLPAADIEALYPGELARGGQAIDHLERKTLAGFPVELHYRIGDHAHWGQPSDVYVDAIPLADFANLRQPAPHVALTIALLHMHKHYGRMPFDCIDIAMLQGTDWVAATELWIEADLASKVLPGLLAHLRTSPTAPELEIEPLLECSTSSDRERVEHFAWHLLDRRFSFLREQRLRCHRHNIGFAAFCLRELFGSPEATTRMTGFPDGDLRHCYHHYLALPLRRILRSLRSR